MELNKKESNKFVKNMIKKDKSKPTKQEIQMAKDIQKNFGNKGFDEDDVLKAWERFELKASNREMFNLKKLKLIFEIWLKIKWGGLLD